MPSLLGITLLTLFTLGFIFAGGIVLQYFSKNTILSKSRKAFRSQKKDDTPTLQKMEETTLIIGSLVKNGERCIPSVIKRCKLLASLFKEVRVYVLENDSKDATRERFLSLTHERILPNLEFNLVNEGEKNLEEYSLSKFKTDARDKSVGRIEKMVFLRNDLLNSIRKFEPEEEGKFLLLTDGDITGTFEKDGIVDTFAHFFKNSSIDAIGFRGMVKNCPFGLCGIVPLVDFCDDYALVGSTVFDFAGVYYQGLRKVISTFSGGVFYRYPLKGEYSLEKSGEEAVCEHVTVNRNLNVYVNTNMLFDIASH